MLMVVVVSVIWAWEFEEIGKEVTDYEKKTALNLIL